MHMTARCLSVAVVATIAPACSLVDSVGSRLSGGVPENQMSEAELRARMVQFSNLFARIVTGAADEMSTGLRDTDESRRILLWKRNVITECRDAALDIDPKAALLDTWTLCIQLRRYFQEGPGTDYLGDRGPTALRAALEAEAQVEEIAQDLLGVRFAEAERSVAEFAARYPMTGGFGRRSFARPSDEDASQASLGWILAIPLVPFRGLNLGIDDAAAAVRDFSIVADRFSTIIDHLPEEVRWEAQLALYDVEARETTEVLRQSLDRLSRTSSSIAATLDRIPEEVRLAIAEGFAEADALQPGLRETLATADAAIREAGRSATEMRGLVVDTRALLAELQGASRSVADAGTAWEGVLTTYRDLAADDDGEDDDAATGPGSSASTANSRGDAPDTDLATDTDVAAGHGDADSASGIAEYGTAADQIGAAATELRALLEDLQSFLRTREWDPALEESRRSAEVAVDHAAERGRGLIDHAAKRIAQLVGLIAAAVLLTRWVSPRRRAAADAD